jgi:hypothetical protein
MLLLYSLSYWHRPYLIQEVAVSLSYWHRPYMIQEVAVIQSELLTLSVHDTRGCCYTVWDTDTVRTWYKRLLLYSLSYWHCPYMIQEVAVIQSEILTLSVHDTRGCCYTVWATDTVRTWYKRLLLYSLRYWHRPYMIQEVAVRQSELLTPSVHDTYKSLP